jgi:fibro-slime domain-containing protein
MKVVAICADKKRIFRSLDRNNGVTWVVGSSSKDTLMRRSPLAVTRTERLTALFVLTLLSPLACGSHPDVGGDGSNIEQGASAGADAGGSKNSSGGNGSGATGPIIEVPDAGGACSDGCDEDATCGDGLLQADSEECDDGNTSDGDGCSPTCTADDGYVCPLPGAMCRAAACGDGLLAGYELCDDGNTDNGDGCNEACSFEANYDCQTPGEPCVKTDCGDGVVQGSEACDDGNHQLGDGCSTFCEKEPSCAPPEPCTSACGDAIKLGDEACDDGNLRDGDGCSSRCEVEQGWTCAEKDMGDLVIPIVYRDFKAYTDGGHVAFQWSSNDPIDRTPKEDIWVRTRLGTSDDTTPEGVSLLGRPVFKWYASCDAAGCQDIAPGSGVEQPADTGGAGDCNAVKGATAGTRVIDTDGRNVYFCGYGDRDFNSFSQWYLDVPDVNQTVLSTLTLTKDADGLYSFDKEGFFPIDGQGFGNYASTGHNFHFTSEVRYWFQYDASKDATLTFNGDDDVWVFVNGRLTVDISGTHSRTEDKVVVNPDSVDMDGQPLDLVDGKIYEIVVFQAERNTDGSNYGLSLDDFSLGKSSCQSKCGDGIVTLDEACDDGVNDGSYGTCNPDCSRAAFCGDGQKDKPQEACDDANPANLDGCNAACQFESVK